MRSQILASSSARTLIRTHSLLPCMFTITEQILLHFLRTERGKRLKTKAKSPIHITTNLSKFTIKNVQSKGLKEITWRKPDTSCRLVQAEPQPEAKWYHFLAPPPSRAVTQKGINDSKKHQILPTAGEEKNWRYIKSNSINSEQDNLWYATRK